MKVSKKKKEYKVGLFLSQISDSISISENGGLTYSGFEVGEVLRLIEKFIDFPECAMHLDKDTLVRRAYKDCLISEDYSESTFFKHIKTHIINELKKVEDTYYLLTTQSLNIKNIETREFNIFDCQVILKESFSDLFTGREDLFEKLKHDIGLCEDVRKYSRVEVKVKSRNKREAFSRALDAINVVRAIVNMQINSSGIIFGDSYKPINKIRLGKVHTLHDESGRAIDHPIFFEPEYREAKVESPKNPEVFQKNIVNIMSWIDKSPFSRKLYSSLLRCSDALDLGDKNVSVIKLWGALESIVADDEPNCDNLPNRLSALYSDSEFTKHVVMHIRDYRNAHVHQGIGDEDSVHRAYHLQNLYNNILLYYSRPTNNFTSLKEANATLDNIAKGKDKLGQEIEAINKALSFFPADVKNHDA